MKNKCRSFTFCLMTTVCTGAEGTTLILARPGTFLRLAAEMSQNRTLRRMVSKYQIMGGLAPRPGLEPGTLRLTVARKALLRQEAMGDDNLL
jgi:hypothetical protein